jgi:predicted nucleic acid-binding protein
VRRLFDASVLVAVFSRELASPQALALLTSEPMPVVNALGLAETRVSLIRKRKRGEMTAEEVRRSLAELQKELDDGLLVLVPQPEAMWDEAVAITERVAVHLRTQDALHAACARLNGIGLATFDGDLTAAARAEGIDVVP